MDFLPLLMISVLICTVNAQEKTCGQVAIEKCLDSIKNTTLLYREIQHLTRSAEKTVASGEDTDDGSSEETEGKTKSVSYVTIAVPSDLSVCGEFQKIDECIMGDMEMCEDVTRASYDGIRVSYQYLCQGAGKEVYPAYSECVSSKDLAGSEHECDADHSEVMDYMDSELTFSIHNYDRGSSDEDCQKYRLMMDLMACQGNAVNKTCGAKVATFWQMFMNKKLLRFTLLAQCDYANDSVILQPGSYDVCDDGSDIYLKSALCDSHFDCMDHSDEKNCTAEEEGFTELSTQNMIVLICIGVTMLVLGIGTICLVKHKENKDFSAKLARQLRDAATGGRDKVRHMRMDDTAEILDDNDDA